MGEKAQRILNIFETGVSETELTETLKTKINASIGGSLGSIKPTGAAPTPARNGNYTFSIGGAKPAWLSAGAGITTVKAGDGVAVVFTAPSNYVYTHVDMSSEFAIKKDIIKTNFKKLGLLNEVAFFVSTAAYQVAESILKIEVTVSDAYYATADIRLYVLFNRSQNPTETLILKNFTDGDVCILTRPSGTNSGVVTLGGGTSGLNRFTVKATLDLDKVPYGFSFYKDNLTESAKMSFLKLSEYVATKTELQTEIIARTALGERVNNEITGIKSSAPSYTAVTGVDEGTNGYYNKDTGIFISNANYKSKKFDIVNGKTYYASGRLSGSANALAVYYNGSTFLSSRFIGVNEPGYVQYTRQLLTVPDNTTKIGISSYGATKYYGVLEDVVFDPVSISEFNDELLKYNKINKYGKKFAIFGTSIPNYGTDTGDSYPQLIAQKMGMTCYNEAVGSSCVRAGGNNTGTSKYGLLKGLHCGVLLRSLSHTIAEKQQLMDKWQSGLDVDGNILEGGTYGYRDFQLDYLADWATSYTSAQILGYSFENKIIKKYLDSTSPTFLAKPDLFVFDHGHNDLVQSTYDVSEAAAIAVPAIRNDRNTFIGAMNYIIDEMLKYDARLKIAFVGHYESDRKVRIYKAQLNLFQYWNFPSLRLWEKTGWSQQIVQTTGYWSSGVWVPSGGSVQNLTLTQIWMQDDLHPGTYIARKYLADCVQNFIDLC